ncbi:MAG TPA: TetR family transcriptional regulator [Mycobacteriales bacterium]|nr:TetR family transcriptional regulator [Mycobacteriales bacterium]
MTKQPIAAGDPDRPPRRAPDPQQGSRNAAHTRERILQAAVAEFGAKGYSGARTAGIAERAGVNPQLISYYFGGKQGLMAELRRRWTSAEAVIAPSGSSMEDAFAAYLDATLDRPDWARLAIWHGLEDNPDNDETVTATQRSNMREAVERVRRRQTAGEVTDELEAEFITLVAYVVAFAPIAMPQVVESIYGVDRYSPDFRRRCREQLARMIHPLDRSSGSQP